MARSTNTKWKSPATLLRTAVKDRFWSKNMPRIRLAGEQKRLANSSTLPLSAFIICFNEEKYIGNCIESLGQCAEIVIVDSGSTDGTAAVVQSYIQQGWPIRFIHEPWRGYSAQKQFALEHCTQPWCLSIDADERVDERLNAGLPQLLQAPEHIVGWRVGIRPFLIGFGYTPYYVQERRRLRLIRKGCGAFDLSLRVHEGIKPTGDVGVIKQGALLHYRPLPIDEQILKENKYSTLKADQKVDAGSAPRHWRLLANPPAYFVRAYFWKGLWRCGFPGFIFAMTGAVYSFLTEVKIYQRNALKRNPPFDCMEGKRSRPVSLPPKRRAA